MIFKKKYIRSEWFEGLLWAEQLRKAGWSDELIYSKVPGNNKSYITTDDGTSLIHWTCSGSRNYQRGVWDYLWGNK